MDLFRVRLNNIDHYQGVPTPFDPVLRSNVAPSQLQNEPKIPVIRVFGSTETGQKVCAHIHGAFPYLYIEYNGSLVPDEVGAFIHRLHVSIDHALAVSYRRNVYDGKNKFVARVTLVKGIPFYGYHVGYRFYLKIYMLNPMVMTRLSDLLRQGAILKTVFQPYEAHLQYLLQWMADYNLYGCGYIDCSKAYFRSPVPQYEEMSNLTHLWHDRSIPPAYISPEATLPRVSHCPIEVDICIHDILNRAEIKPRSLHHDFIERLNPLAPDEKLVHSMAGLWRDETRRRKSKMVNPESGSSPFPREVMISMSADVRNSQRGGWIHEEDYMEQVKRLMQDEKAKSDGANLSFDTFTRRTPFEAAVKTVLESVEDLFPQNLAVALGLKYEQTQLGLEDVKDEEFEVDEQRIFNFMDDNDEFPYDSDEEVMRELELSQRKKGDHIQEEPMAQPEDEKPEHDVDEEKRPADNLFKEQFADAVDPVSVQDKRVESSSEYGSSIGIQGICKPGPREREYKGKRKSCVFWARKGACAKGSACGFLHEAAEGTHPVRQVKVKEDIGRTEVRRSPVDQPDIAIDIKPIDNVLETTEESGTPAYLSMPPSAREKAFKGKRRPCVFYAKGNCAKGSACGFLHSTSNTDTDTTVSPKRLRTDTPEDDRDHKRQRIELAKKAGTKVGTELQRHANASKIVGDVAGVKTRTISEHQPIAPPTINGIIKPIMSKKPREGSGSNLGFPVVKDPLDPATILRLSQGRSSQKDLDPTPSPQKAVKDSPKTVSFDLDVPSSQQRSSGDTSVSLLSLQPSDLFRTVLQNMNAEFPPSTGAIVYVVGEQPPTSFQVLASMADYGLPQVVYQDAYYSQETDVPERAREWAGREFKLESLTVPYLAPFDPTATSPATYGEKLLIVPDRVKDEAAFVKRRRACHLSSWEFGEPPPTYQEVAVWVEEENAKSDEVQNQKSKCHTFRSPNKLKLSQVEGPTQKNKHGFKYTQKQKATSVKHEAQYMSLMSLEVHVNTRGKFVPNPEEDEIQCIFWCVQGEDENLESNGRNPGTHVGIVVLAEDDNEISQKIARQTGFEVREETSELDLIVRMVEIVRTHDPDILTGYEVHGGSWGFLIERARLKYEYNLCDEFSRMKSQSHGRFGKDNDKWGFNNTSTIRVTGRHMINIWRAMRGELNLLQYTMENVVFHLLHKRIPHYSWTDLTAWYISGNQSDLAKLLEYYCSRVQIDLEILEQNELVPRTSEQARLLGVDFFSVFSRGSQFKVESLMFRIAKPENFMLVSPSRKQVGGQNALECLPLVMEPQSAFYNSPLLVLDFQSLYPSVMIAYNYCYSTFLGRVVNWRGTNKMGFSEYKRQQRMLELLKDHINIAPNGIMYVKPEIRKSLLAKMLGEILETRVMVKSGMKVDKEDKTLQRLLNNRQLALKLIANVTYGYTSASFSGRMPCSEIADSIVQTGRETLEKAIALIHSVKRWGAEVVYGDTDSLFVYLKGRTKDEAFDIGEEIAKTVTNMNPRPVKLKFEKVYYPCVLIAKKRYVGFKYEHRDQKEPDFDAKGIETVRRDGTPAEQKIEEKALKILFRTADLSLVKSYFQKECEKIMKGSVSIQDFCFAKEVKLGTYSENGLPPPGALISTKRMLEDARAEPQYGERVPYVVITGAPGARLIDRCVAPETLLHSDHSELDAEYYISKNLIPPLERIFNLVGANVRSWYDEMPKIQRIRRVDANVQLPNMTTTLSKKTLESYMKSSSCLVCNSKLEGSTILAICDKCRSNRPVSLLAVRSKLQRVERKNVELAKICRSCAGLDWVDEVKCDSKDCPVFYTRTRQAAKLRMERAVSGPVMEVLQEGGGEFEGLEW